MKISAFTSNFLFKEDLKHLQKLFIFYILLSTKFFLPNPKDKLKKSLPLSYVLNTS